MLIGIPLPTVKTDYVGNKVYKNGTLSMMQNEEGYITFSGATPTYHYYLKDHQGNNRVVMNQNGTVEQVNHYYPFGGLFGEGLQTVNQPYKYNGKELDRFEGLDMYDYGARHYDAALGRWHSPDPAKELYWNNSSYNYALNNPTNSIDPDGNIVIFINGFTTDKTQQGKAKYWDGFDKAVMRQLNDDNKIYRHGGNRFSTGSRVLDGYGQGQKDAVQILKSITDENGNPKETIKIITHSMGGAYGKGYVLALKKYIKENGYKNVLITLQADFDPYQASNLSSIDNVYTMQFTHKKKGDGNYPWLANQKQNNLEDENYHDDESKGYHDITSFLGDISKLKEGTYLYNNGEWVLQMDKKKKKDEK